MLQRVCVTMTLDVRQCLACLGGYALLTGGLIGLVVALGQGVASDAIALLPEIAAVGSSGPSRVDDFKRGEAAARDAPGVPVPRVLTAYGVPDLPVQALAVGLDEAESIAAKPMPHKRKKGPRVAKADARKKSRVGSAGQIPKTLVQAESTRDITNRNLGVLVALAP